MLEGLAGGPLQAPKKPRLHQGIQVAISASLWQVLTGTDRALCFSTLYLYLQTFWNAEAADYFYSLIQMSFALGTLVSVPFFGYAASKGVRAKILLLLANFFNVSGNLLYALAATPHLCLAGRFISGIGGGPESCLYSDITRTVRPKLRTPVVLAIAVGKIVGLGFGPILNLLIPEYQADSNRHFNVYTAPGYAMAILWLIHSFSLIWYPVLDSEGNWVDMNSYRSDGRNMCLHILCEKSIKTSDDGLIEQTKKLFRGLEVFKTYATLVTMFLIFNGSFNSMCLEVFLPLLAERYYGWTEKQVSYVYFGVVAMLLISALIFSKLTTMITDRIALCLAICIMLFAYSLLCVAVILIGYKTHRSYVISMSIIACMLHSASMPGVITIPDSIFSKLVPLHEIDRAQTFARFLSNSGFALGIFIGGKFVTIPMISSFCMVASALLPLCLVLLRFQVFSVHCYKNAVKETEISANL